MTHAASWKLNLNVVKDFTAVLKIVYLSIDFAPNIVCGQVVRQVPWLVAKSDQVLHFDRVIECWKNLPITFIAFWN